MKIILRKSSWPLLAAYSVVLQSAPWIEHPALYKPILDIFTQYDIPLDRQGATVFSLLYGYPLPSYGNIFRGALGLQAIGTNSLYSLKALATPESRTVVRPNVDTIYSLGILDLAREDVVLTIPPFQPGRYYLFSFYDPFGDNYASLGSVNKSPPGDYLIRSALGTGRAGPSTKDCNGYQGCIESATLEGTLLIRVEVKNNGSDIGFVNKYLNQCKLTSKMNHAGNATPFIPADLQNLSLSRPESALQLTDRLMDRNPPQDPFLAVTIPEVLRFAGVANGVYQQPAGVDLTQAYSTFNNTLGKFYFTSGNNVPLNNGWSVLSTTYSGSFERGTNIVARAFVAEFGYLQNTADQAIYPTPPKRSYTLEKDQALLLTFSGVPPLASDGFWSITIYDADGYLIPNPQGIYALGDRSGLTYADGSPVYGVGAKQATNEPFQLLVQESATAPPANWTSNWLPSPDASQVFQLTLRFYAQDQALVDGSYQYPVIEQQKALTA